MEERLKNKLAYLYGMSEKYIELNKRTRLKYQWRLDAIFEEIEALQNDVTGEWDKPYEEDLRESNL